MTSRRILKPSRRSFVGLTFLIAGLLAAVPSTAAAMSSPPPEVSAEGMVFSEHARVLSQATIEKLTSVSAGGQVVFSTSTPELDALVPGDVIICPPSLKSPFAFARRVVAVVDGRGPVVLQTAAPAIGDVIVDGRIEVQGFLDTADVDATKLPQGMALQADPLTGDLVFKSFNVVLFDADGNQGTTNDQIRANGQIQVSSEYRLTLDVEGTTLKEFSASLEIHENSSLTLEGQLDRSFDARLPIASFTLPTIPIVPPVLWVVPRLTFSVGASGAVHADFSTGVTHTTDVSGWVGYEDGRFDARGSESSGFNYVAPELNGNLNAKADVQARLEFRPWDTVSGPWALVEAYLRLYADIHAAHWWQLYAGLRSQAGIPISGLPEPELFKQEWLILQENDAPSLDAGGPYQIDEGGSITLVALGSDPEGDDLVYSWDLDGDGIFEAAGRQVTFAAGGYDGPASQALRAKVTDEAGPYSSLTTVDATSVAILNAPPVVGAISVSPNSVPIGSSVTTTASFTDVGVFDTHTAVWDWGDGTTSPGTVAESGGAGRVAGDHTYSTPGVYELSLRVADDDGGTGESAFTGMVVTAPSGSSVSGNGKVDGGKSWQRLKLEVQYHARTGLPEGKVRFDAQLATPSEKLKLDLRSTSVDGLRVEGNQAVVRGRGDLNGEPGYGFQLEVLDGGPHGTNDRFALVITGPGGLSQELGGELRTGNLTVIE